MISPDFILRQSVESHLEAIGKLPIRMFNEFSRAVEILAIRFLSGNKILICGNGGSAADAQHLAAEFVIRYKEDRFAIPAIALTTDTSILTAAYNDGYGVFKRQIEALGAPGDVLIAISTSGKSENIIQAMQAAKRQGLTVIGLTGQHGFRDMHQPDINLGMDVELRVPSDSTNVIQEIHIILYHALVEAMEQKLNESGKDSTRLL